jgi:hypothetical protein
MQRAPTAYFDRCSMHSVNNLPGAVGREDGLIDTVDDMVTELATDIRNIVDATGSAGSARTLRRKRLQLRGDYP